MRRRLLGLGLVGLGVLSLMVFYYATQLRHASHDDTLDQDDDWMTTATTSSSGSGTGTGTGSGGGNSLSLSREKALAANPLPPGTTRILAWTQVNGKPGFEGFHINFCGPQQPTCQVTHHRSLFNDSAALLFSSTDVRLPGRLDLDLPRSRRGNVLRDPLQPWVLYTEVSPLEHPAPSPVLDPTVVRQFDYWMSYRLDSDFPIPAIAGSDLVSALSAPLDTTLIHARFASSSAPPTRAPILWISSGVCASDNHRHVLVAALEAAGLPVDSLHGACPTDLGRPVSPATDGDLVGLLRQYKFVLVLETSNCHDYVSRALVHALQAQSLPIVDGPPRATYAQILGPTRIDSVLLADAQPIATLVQLVADLANSEQKYLDRMRTARAQPVDRAWHAQWTHASLLRGRRSGWCGVCAMAHAANTRREAEHAHQAAARAARQAREARLAAAMAEVDSMRAELVSTVRVHAVSPKARKRVEARWGKLHAVVGPHNASVWANSSAYLPLPPAADLRARALVLESPRLHPVPRRRLLAPDYSCRLRKWAAVGEDDDPAVARKHYRAQGLPDAYVAHALAGTAPRNVTWPRPVRRRKRGKSTYADLTGELVAAAAARAAQVMDPSEANGKPTHDEDEDETTAKARKPRLELEYPATDAELDDDDNGPGNWDVLDGVLVGLFVTGVAGMFSAALGMTTATSPRGTDGGTGGVALVALASKRKRVTSLTSAMAAAPSAPGAPTRLLPLRRQSVHANGAVFVASPVEEGDEHGLSTKML